MTFQSIQGKFLQIGVEDLKGEGDLVAEEEQERRRKVRTRAVGGERGREFG